MLKIYNSTPKNLELLTKISKSGFGTKILKTFDKGRIEEWIESKQILNSSKLRGDFIIKVAKKLRRLHDKLNLNHNDLNLTNILITNSDVVFIDFEFAGKKDIYYDIANFFCEFMYNYGSKEWYYYNLDLFPSKCFIKLFCIHYFQTEDITCINSHIYKILSCMKKVNKFWINWSYKYNQLEYKLYGLFRKNLCNINFEKELEEKKNIYCDGTFDLPHTGHLNFFKKIRDLGCKKLIVGILSDKDVESYKRIPILDSNTRANIVSAFNLVDDVVINCPFFNLDNEFINYYGIDLIVYGGDPNTKNPLDVWEDHYKAAIDNNILKMINYSDGISTSKIIFKIKNS